MNAMLDFSQNLKSDLISLYLTKISATPNDSLVYGKIIGGNFVDNFVLQCLLDKAT